MYYKKIENIFGELASCFVTEKNGLIICFYGYKNGEYVSYLLIAYNNQFKQLTQNYFNTLAINMDAFFYSIFFREDSGAFIYYNNQTLYYGYPNNLINDLIKLSDNKLAFFTSSANLEILFIVILNIFNANNINNIKIRYYSIENYKIIKF